YFFIFFCQAEDGIRDRNVTGVQTCALPISSGFNAVTPSVVSEQPVETFGLEAEKIRRLERLGDLREGNAAGRGPVSDSFLCSSRGARGSQEGFLPYETCVHTRALSSPPPLLPDRVYPAV